MASAFIVRPWHQVVNKVPRLNLDPRPLYWIWSMLLSRELEQLRLRNLQRPYLLRVAMAHRSCGHAGQWPACKVEGTFWPDFNYQMHYLMLHSPGPILGPLTLSLLSHEDITACNNMRQIGRKRRLLVRRDQAHLPAYIVDLRAPLLLLPCIPTSTGVQFDILCNVRILHDAGYDGWIKMG
jgi:hypothetical protein